MPYTRPSHRSLVSSASTVPDDIPSSSSQSGSKPFVLRAASYLDGRGRATSATAAGDMPSPSPDTNDSEDNKHEMLNLGGNLRQSQPPQSEDKGLQDRAVISLIESPTSARDEDEPTETKSRRSETLVAPRETVSQVSTTATPTPQQAQPNGTIYSTTQARLSTTVLSNMPKSRGNGRLHTVTESNAPMLKLSGLLSASEEDTGEACEYKPPMVRNKSGEFVRPALRGHRRPSSMPATPVFSKAVHFDSDLEHVRHFSQMDQPLSVSAGSSPAQNPECDLEYPFPNDSCSGKVLLFEWELLTPNFPPDSPVRKVMPVRLEKIWLSNDQKFLLGSVAVTNFAFHKTVICRFTMDYWTTISEVSAEYTNEIYPGASSDSRDRFKFVINLSDMADLESKTLFVCIRYAVNGKEYWDNNNRTNFWIDFKKNHLPLNCKNNFHGAASKCFRPISMPPAVEAVGNMASKFKPPIYEHLDESKSVGGHRFKSKSCSNLANDNMARDLVSPCEVALSNRCDFSASLDTAVKAIKTAEDSTTAQTKTERKDTVYMKRNVLGTESYGPTPFTGSSPNKSHSSLLSSLPSSSYEELLDKYCFARTPDPRFNKSDYPSTA